MDKFSKLFTLERNNIINKLKTIIKERELILFGSGGVGQVTLNRLKSLNIFVTAFCDNDNSKILKNVDGIPVFSYTMIREKYPNAFIIITVGPQIYINSIIKQLDNDIFKNNYIVSDGFYIYQKDEINDMFLKNYSSIKNVYNSLYDQRSKYVYINKINYILSGNMKFLDDISDIDQYFCKDFIQIDKNDIFIDCGGYDGKNTIDFIKHVNNTNAQSIIFEPDPENIKKLYKNVQRYKNVKIIQAATWSQSTTLNICYTFGQGTRLSPSGSNNITTTSIDDFLNGERATFIKMDVEGAEFETIKGAKKTILKYNPILAICIYHSFEDHWRIPELLFKYCKQYKFYIRNHYDSLIETVFYAIPINKEDVY